MHMFNTLSIYLKYLAAAPLAQVSELQDAALQLLAIRWYPVGGKELWIAMDSYG